MPKWSQNGPFKLGGLPQKRLLEGSSERFSFYFGFASFLLCFGLHFWSDFGDFWSPRVAIRTRLREHCGWRPPCFFYPKGAENSPKTCQEHAENQCRKQVPLNGGLSTFICNLPSTVRLQPSLGAPTPICPTSK